MGRFWQGIERGTKCIDVQGDAPKLQSPGKKHLCYAWIYGASHGIGDASDAICTLSAVVVGDDVKNDSEDSEAGKGRRRCNGWMELSRTALPHESSRS